MHFNSIKGKNISSYFHLYSLKNRFIFPSFKSVPPGFLRQTMRHGLLSFQAVRDLFDTEPEGWLHLVVESAPVSRVLTVSKWASALVSSAWIPHMTRPTIDFAWDGLLGEVGYTGGDVKVRLGIPWIVMWGRSGDSFGERRRTEGCGGGESWGERWVGRCCVESIHGLSELRQCSWGSCEGLVLKRVIEAPDDRYRNGSHWGDRAPESVARVAVGVGVAGRHIPLLTGVWRLH